MRSMDTRHSNLLFFNGPRRLTVSLSIWYPSIATMDLGVYFRVQKVLV